MRAFGPSRAADKRVGARAALAAVLVACLAAPRPGHAEPPPPGTTEPAKPPANFQAPRLLHFVQAPPPASLGGREAAEVVLTIDVDEKGAVRSVEVARSAGGEEGPALDAAAVEAAKQFVFEPGRADGKAVPVRITYSYRFVVKPVETAPSRGAPVAPGGPTVPLEGFV